jgi:hypothetical protein
VKKIILAGLLFSNLAKAQSHFSVGLDMFATKSIGMEKSNDNVLKKPLQNITGLSFGAVEAIDDYFIGFRTNALLPFSQTQTVRLANGFEYQEKSKIKTHSLYGGKKFGNVAPFVVATKIQRIADIMGKRYESNGVFLGTGLGYSFLGNQSISFTYFFVPKSHKTIQQSFGISYNFYFI